MALPDFPNNPTLNEQFTVGTNIYQWDGEKWKALSNADNSLRSQLADVDSAVLVGGVEAKELAKIYNSENADVEVLRIPTDYPTLTEACNAAKSDVTQYEILIETGHALTEGLSVVGADFSNITIKSEDATVFLDAGFTGVDVTPYIADYAGIVGETPRPPLFFALYGKLPKLECLIDMAKLYGTGIQLAESDCVVAQACGVINAGFRGIQVHGRANIYGSNFSGAVGAGIRVQQASSCCANNAVVDNCMSGVDGSEAAIYASRSSTLEFRYGSAQNSGANGLTARRSIVTADDVNVDGASGRGIRAESLAQVSFSNGFARNTLNPSVEAISGANIYAVGSQLSTISSAKQINVDVGGTVHIAGATTVEGVNATEASVFTYSNVRYTNTFDADGMVFFDSANGTFKITSNANGVSQRFADGRMLTFINTVVDFASVPSGGFSAQLTMPTQPDTFVNVDGSIMEVVGRTAAGGGGNRVAVNNYYRPSVLTGNEFRVQNTGQQLDGSATGLSVQSINLHMITYGTWR